MSIKRTWETSYLIPRGSADGEWGVCEADGGDMVAHVDNCQSDPEAVANLIAAAQDMRAALSAALHALETPGDFTAEELRHVQEDAAAALAKVKGDA